MPVLEFAQGGKTVRNPLAKVEGLFRGRCHLVDGRLPSAGGLLEAKQGGTGVGAKLPAAGQEVRLKVGDAHPVDAGVNPAPGIHGSPPALIRFIIAPSAVAENTLARGISRRTERRLPVRFFSPQSQPARETRRDHT